MAAIAAQQARANFPVPPELREAIYSYFMGIYHDPFDDDRSEAPSRECHTQIFKINKTIRDEAMAYLYRTHPFICLDYLLPNFPDMLLAYNVPVITAPKIWPAFDNRVLDIFARIQSFENGDIVQEHDVECSCGQVLMLVRDLPALCEMLRIVALLSSANFVFIDTPRGQAIKPQYTFGIGFTLKLDLTVNKTDVTNLSEGAQMVLLQNMRAIKGDVIATFNGFTVSQAITKAVSRDMRPSLVWRRARDWDTLATINRWKRRLDLLVSSPSREKQALACRMHTQVIGDYQRADEIFTEMIVGDPAVRVAGEHKNLLVLDSMLHATQTLVKAGMLNDAYEALQDWEGSGDLAEDSVIPPASTKAIFRRLQYDLAACLSIEAGMNMTSFAAHIRQAEKLAQEFPEDKHLSNDVGVCKNLLELFERRADQAEKVRFPEVSGHLIPLLILNPNIKFEATKQLSLFTMPPQVVDSLPPTDQLGCPEGLSGWEDMQHKAELTQKERDKINEMQREHGLPETVF